MHAEEMKRGDLIMACHDATRGHCDLQHYRKAFLGRPRRILWFSPLTSRPVVWAGGLWFAAVKSWVGVR